MNPRGLQKDDKITQKIDSTVKRELYGNKDSSSYSKGSFQRGKPKLDKNNKQKSKNSKAKITINEIDELEVAMDLLFGEQQA